MPIADDLLDLLEESGVGNALNEVGSRIRYGVSPVDRYKAVLAQPEMRGPSRQSDKTEAERRVSTALATQQWGPIAPILFNAAREGMQGASALAHGEPFYTPGGFQADDPTPDDKGRGFNLRSMATGLNTVTQTDPRLRLARAVFEKFGK